jgi:uncharacterized RDD family membrane protein YckC
MDESLTRPAAEPGIQYAGFGQRLAAYFLDGVILSAVDLVVGFTVGVAIGLEFAFSHFLALPHAKVPQSTDTEAVIISEGLFVLVAFAYFSHFWRTRGATLGDRVIQIRVIDSSSYSSLSTRQSVVRALGYFLSGLILYIGFIWAAFDSRKQGWHDKMGHTVVVKDPH